MASKVNLLDPTNSSQFEYKKLNQKRTLINVNVNVNVSVNININVNVNVYKCKCKCKCKRNYVNIKNYAIEFPLKTFICLYK